jgi:hypothetical protein
MKMSKMESNEETLRKGSMPTGNGGLMKKGNKQGEHTKTTSDGGSNLETLRQADRPKPEAHREADMDTKAQKKAHMFNERSQNGGAEKEGGW